MSTLNITFTEHKPKRKRVIDFMNDWCKIIDSEANVTKTVDSNDNTVTTYETPTSKLVISQNKLTNGTHWDWVAVPGISQAAIKAFLEENNGPSI